MEKRKLELESEQRIEVETTKARLKALTEVFEGEEGRNRALRLFLCVFSFFFLFVFHLDLP